MSKGSGHTKVVKRSFNKQLMRCLGPGRISQTTGFKRLAGFGGDRYCRKQVKTRRNNGKHPGF